MKPSTFIKLDRNILDSSYYEDADTLRIWITLLILAAHKNTEVNGIELLRGQLLTTYSALCERLQLSLKKVRVVLDRFEKDGSICRESVKNRFTIITIVNYSLYQGGANQRANQIEKRGKPNGKPKNADKTLENNDFYEAEEPKGANQTANQIEKRGKPKGNDTRIFKEYLKEYPFKGYAVVNNLPEETKDKQSNNKYLCSGGDTPDMEDDEYYRLKPIYGEWTETAVILSDYQTDKLFEIMSFDEFLLYTEKLSDFIEKVIEETGNPPKIKSHYKMILKWFNEDRRA